MGGVEGVEGVWKEQIRFDLISGAFQSKFPHFGDETRLRRRDLGYNIVVVVVIVW
jgi:hypothetical protein